ncbi:hypothetical protein Lesp02_32380 [Lentzea sp. NBRC 105346]|uniref:DUF742 domain-containing protein n=1 Tax=Lentzea sp. NBRC 105346 TaxID=3032205 RepID=UPI0024A0BF8C|nr:DUF742 domain-containing protein [Lentzea sp. NBRC 105346]GLZ31049.1 hypothetical protein Lesp02_32380 [Lentzea sp. NBRC 105346]
MRFDDETDEEPVSFADLLNGFSLDSARIRRRADDPPAPEPSVPEEDLPDDLFDTQRFDLFPAAPADRSASIVRAYAWTGGRTKSDYHLEIETLVSVNERAQHAQLRPEHHEVLELCHQPRSVAEVAALRGLPLGVAKVLLGDMAGRGLLDVHLTASSNGQDRPDMGLLERVLTGLKRL